MPEVHMQAIPLYGVSVILDGVERLLPDADARAYRELVIADGGSILDDRLTRWSMKAAWRDIEGSDGCVHVHYLLHEKCIAIGLILSPDGRHSHCEHSPYGPAEMDRRCRETHQSGAGRSQRP